MKRGLTCIIAIIATILSVLTLTFHVAMLSEETMKILKDEAGMFGELIPDDISLNGFDLLDDLGDLEGMMQFYGFMNILIIIIAIVNLLAIIFVQITGQVEEKGFGVYFISILSFVGIGIFYWLEGLDIVGKIQKNFETGYEIGYSKTMVIKVKTESFYPLIFATILFFLFFFCYTCSDDEKVVENKVKNKSLCAVEQKEFGVDTKLVIDVPKKDTLSEEKKLELLLKYKELKESGVLTDEEFEKKKKELL